MGLCRVGLVSSLSTSCPFLVPLISPPFSTSWPFLLSLFSPPFLLLGHSAFHGFLLFFYFSTISLPLVFSFFCISQPFPLPLFLLFFYFQTISLPQFSPPFLFLGHTTIQVFSIVFYFSLLSIICFPLFSSPFLFYILFLLQFPQTFSTSQPFKFPFSSSFSTSQPFPLPLFSPLFLLLNHSAFHCVLLFFYFSIISLPLVSPPLFLFVLFHNHFPFHCSVFFLFFYFLTISIPQFFFNLSTSWPFGHS